MEALERESLLRLSEGLLDQFSAIGCIGLFSGSPSKLLSNSRHINLARSFFLAREAVEDLPSGPPGRAYIYNKSLWHDEIPIAGYLKEQPSLLCSDLVRSFDAMWMLHAERGHAMAPALKGAASICCAYGLERAIAYLFDLQRDGYTAGIQTLLKALNLLIWARDQVDDDQKIAHALFADVPTTNQEWLNAKLRTNTGPLAESGPRHAYVAEVILNKCLDEVDRVKSWSNYSDWILGQMNLGVTLNAALLIVKHLDPNPTLQKQAVLARLEEIMSDGMGRFAPVVTGHILRADFSFARSLSRKLAAIDPNNWKRSLFQERAVVPYALRRLIDEAVWLTEDTQLPMPEGWHGVSCELAFPICMSLREQEPSPWIRVQPFSMEELKHVLNRDDLDSVEYSNLAQSATELELNKAYEAAKRKTEADDHGAAARTLEKVLELYPWHHLTRVMLAQSLVALNDFQGAFEQTIKAVLNSPFQPTYWLFLEHLYRSREMRGGISIVQATRQMVEKLLRASRVL